MSIEQQIGALVEASNDLTKTINNKIGDIDKEVAQKLGEAQASFQSLASSLNIISGYCAINDNGDFMETIEASTSSEEMNIYPKGFGVNKGRNECVKVEVIPVISGDEPITRDAEAQELLDFMGIGQGRTHFSSSFNIMKMTIIDSSFVNELGYDFYIPQQHVKISPSATFMAYYKTVGDFSVSNLGNSNGVWQRHISHKKTTNPGTYTHIDLNFNNDVRNGDVLFLALPTICTGFFPKDIMHGNLYNRIEYHQRRYHKQ